MHIRSIFLILILQKNKEKNQIIARGLWLSEKDKMKYFFLEFFKNEYYL
jgi:hypothetical protein